MLQQLGLGQAKARNWEPRASSGSATCEEGDQVLWSSPTAFPGVLAGS